MQVLRVVSQGDSRRFSPLQVGAHPADRREEHADALHLLGQKHLTPNRLLQALLRPFHKRGGRLSHQVQHLPRLGGLPHIPAQFRLRVKGTQRQKYFPRLRGNGALGQHVFYFSKSKCVKCSVHCICFLPFHLAIIYIRIRKRMERKKPMRYPKTDTRMGIPCPLSSICSGFRVQKKHIRRGGPFLTLRIQLAAFHLRYN